MKQALTLSMIDQAVLSAQSILFTFLLIWLGDAEAVGRFALALSSFFIFLTVQNALIGTPLMTQVYGHPAPHQARVLTAVCTFDLYILAGAALGSFILLAAVGFTAVQIAAAVLMILSGLLRELSRSISMSTGAIGTCLTIDVSAVAVCFALLPPLIGLAAPEVIFLLCIAIGNLTAILVWRPPFHMAASQVIGAVGAYRPYLAQTRWSLVSAVSAEIQNRGFLFVVDTLRGTAATGLIQVGRSVVSPLSLVGMAWGRVALPHMAAHFSNNAPARAYAIMYASMLCILILALGYFALLYSAWDLFDRYILHYKYPGVDEIVVGWCVFTVISEPMRCLGWAFEAAGRFRELALLALPSAIGVTVLMTALALAVPLYTTLVILTAAQVVVAVVLLWLLPVRRPAEEVLV